MKEYPLLDKVNTPEDLRLLDLNSLPQLCNELRDFVLTSVAKTGGHLASGLGVVELTVAIHYVFDTPKDSLIWDVGHQAYPHKVLTGRRNKMDSIKRQGGLSGFPNRKESEYDDFGVGHSSTSISAALGMAIANQLQGIDSEHIAVIGDGAMTAGMAFEAIHHAASLSANVLVILNDNDMSISQSVGGFSSYLSKVLMSDLYHDVRRKSKRVLKRIPPFDDLAKFAENTVKDFAGMSNIFEDFGFDYTGPIDGHQVIELVHTLRSIKAKKGPRLLHVKTMKGKGYSRAELAPIDYHGVKEFDLKEGLKKEASSITYTQLFSDWVCRKAKEDKNLVAITPAMCEGSGLVEFRETFPSRFFDVAIAEQHAVTLAAGMACKGLKPVVAIYSTFLQRAYDQLIHDVALQNLNVLFAVDRAGIVGEDGATHAGTFDIAYTRILPNMLVMAPSCDQEMLALLDLAYDYDGPSLVRYPKGVAHREDESLSTEKIQIGKAKEVVKGKGLAIIVFGTFVQVCEPLAKAYRATLLDMRFIKPFDKESLRLLLDSHDTFLIIEEGSLIGGVGESVGSFLQSIKTGLSIEQVGIADEFVEHGSRAAILSKYRLDKISLKAVIKSLVN